LGHYESCVRHAGSFSQELTTQLEPNGCALFQIGKAGCEN